jgi:hypothetical protein
MRTGELVNVRTSIASTAHRAVALAALALCLAFVAGCTEVTVDPTGTPIGRNRLDTLIIESTRSDTVVHGQFRVVTSTIVKEFVVRDTVRGVDTLVRVDTIARHPERIATIYKMTTERKLDSVVVDISANTTMNVSGPDARLRFELETLIGLSRPLRDERFGDHGWSSLFIYIPDMEIRPGSVKLQKDPDDKERGAELVVRDRTLQTGVWVGPWQMNEADFRIDSINVKSRVLHANFRGRFYQASGVPPDTVFVAFHLGY